MNSPWHRLERYLKTTFQFIILPLIMTITIQGLCFVGVMYLAFTYHPNPELYSTFSPSDWQKTIKCLWQLSLEYTALMHLFMGISILTYAFIQNKAKSLSKNGRIQPLMLSKTHRWASNHQRHSLTKIE